MLDGNIFNKTVRGIKMLNKIFDDKDKHASMPPPSEDHSSSGDRMSKREEKFNEKTSPRDTVQVGDSSSSSSLSPPEKKGHSRSRSKTFFESVKSLVKDKDKEKEKEKSKSKEKEKEKEIDKEKDKEKEKERQQLFQNKTVLINSGNTQLIP
jgi:hypothetical protein